MCDVKILSVITFVTHWSRKADCQQKYSVAVFYIMFHVRRSRGKVYIGHGHLCVCLSVRHCIPTLLHEPDINWGNDNGCPLVVHY